MMAASFSMPPTDTALVAPRDSTDAERARQAWRVLSVTSLGMTLTFLNTSTLNIALPVLTRHFGATATQASWFVLSYLLVNTAFILVFGRMTDLLGRKRLYMAGLAVITLASLASAFAPTADALIGLRAVQGIGGAAILANTTALLVDAFPDRLLALGLSLNVTAASAANVLGPAVGGLLVTSLGWRAVFWFNVPVGVGGLWWAGRVLPNKVAIRRGTEGFDYAGGLLTVLILALVVFVLSRGNELGWTGATTVSLGTATVALFVALIVVERGSRHPLIDPMLFRNRARSMAYAATTMMSVAQSAVALLVSLFLQAIQGASPLQAGLWITPLAGGIMVASPVAGKLATRIEPRKLSSAGFAVTAAGLLVLAIGSRPDSSRLFLSLSTAAIGLGCGIFQAPNTASLMADVPPHRRGIASGLRSTLQSTGQVVSTAMCLAIVTAAVSTSQRQAFYSGSVDRSPAHLDEFVDGFRTAFAVLFALCLVGIAASLLRGSRAVRDADAVPARGGADMASTSVIAAVDGP
ncbi:MAG: hypothetical protein QOH29_1697 [Actinomycetota bacterium]|nr:hypothetical protein [Actinomycetota bacterium]